MVDEVAQRFEHRLKTSPGLIYAVAQARRSDGKQDEAEQLAKRACDLLGNSAEDHCTVGYQLRKRGLFDWSEREFRRSIDCAGDDGLESYAARYYLADLLFDLEREYEAGEMLQKLSDLLASRNENSGLLGKYPIRSRMHYYFACHYEKQNAEPKKIRRALEDGLRYDATDADILISLYRLSADDPALRKQVVEKIAAAAEEFRSQITQSAMDDPDEQATPYNQYAWLIGNTEGNFDLAIQYSHKSLEIMPDTAGYLDTLAHCYAGKGDFKNAVHYQARAVELEPFTMQIQRSLDKFKAALAKQETEHAEK
jgi:tetratricopeptide (TPR) repeat protein